MCSEPLRVALGERVNHGLDLGVAHGLKLRVGEGAELRPVERLDVRRGEVRDGRGREERDGGGRDLGELRRQERRDLIDRRNLFFSSGALAAGARASAGNGWVVRSTPSPVELFDSAMFFCPQASSNPGWRSSPIQTVGGAKNLVIRCSSIAASTAAGSGPGRSTEVAPR